jgi:hypothetical protein
MAIVRAGRDSGGRMIEYTLIGAALLFGGVVLAPRHPAWLILTLLGIAWFAVPRIVGLIAARRARRAIRTRLDELKTGGFSPDLVLEGNLVVNEVWVALDFASARVACVTPERTRVLPLSALRSVSLGAARALGQSTPSWYSLSLGFDSETDPGRDSFWVAARRKRACDAWLEALRPRVPAEVRVSITD